MMNPLKAFLVITVLASLLLIQTVSGQGISAGPLRIKPSIELWGGSDSNVLLLPEDMEEDDTFFIIRPGVSLELPYRDHLFRLDYGFEMQRFSDFDSEDSDLHDLIFEGLITVNSDFRIRLLEKYKELSGSTEEIIGRVEYSTNHAEISGEYDLNSKLSITGGYANLKYDYDDPALIGRTENIITAGARYNMFDRWGFLAEISHGEVDIEKTGDDASFNRFLVGVRGEFTPKLTGIVKGGWEWRSYDGPREDNDLGYITAEIVHQVASDMKLHLSATRELNESITYDGTAYTATQGKAMFTKDFADRITLILSAYYQTNDYEEPVLRGDVFESREDNIWQGEIGVQYNLNRWTQLLASVEKKKDNSNFDENDYEVTRFKIGARLEY